MRPRSRRWRSASRSASAVISARSASTRPRAAASCCSSRSSNDPITTVPRLHTKETIVAYNDQTANLPAHAIPTEEQHPPSFLAAFEIPGHPAKDLDGGEVLLLVTPHTSNRRVGWIRSSNPAWNPVPTGVSLSMLPSPRSTQPRATRPSITRSSAPGSSARNGARRRRPPPGWKVARAGRSALASAGG
jgi:hypothetical protein